MPSKPHVETSAAAQAVASRGVVPAATNVQVPIEPAAAQVLHDSVHAALQQTPSTQKLLAQSDAQLQDWPLLFFVRASVPQVASAPGASLLASSPTPAPAAPSAGPSAAS